MRKIKRKKAVRGSSSQRSPVIVSRVSKSDIAILNSRLEPILSANKKQRTLGENAITETYLA